MHGTNMKKKKNIMKLLKVGELGREDVSWKFLAKDCVQLQDMMLSVSVVSGSSIRC